ncbi:MAG: DUF5309 family protein [Planctomycetota bacterium]|nr:DUF5309 family protein [Planctomycetota bacterium]
MAINVNVAHVAESYDSGNIKEDVSDIIFNIDPSDTPVLSNAGRRDVSNTTFEWNVESLPTTSSTNAKAEGADFASEAPVQVTRKTNVTQISSRNATVSGTQMALAQYGKSTASEMAHQMALMGKAIKLDIEKALVSHNKQGAGSGDQATNRQTQSIPHQIARGNNVDVGTTNGSTAPASDTADFTEGSAVESLTEGKFLETAQTIFENGGNLNTVVCSPALKREISDFQGRSGTQVIVDPEKVSNNITLIASDFGDIKVMVSRSMTTFGSSGAAGTDLLYLDWEYTKVAFLRPFTRQQIAKQGDSDSEQIICEWGAQVSNADSCGIRLNLSNTYS